ncbi:hypothetical protein GCM10012288_09250 [Malaciobacter pacificus]|jgi:hypothetical protein|uniref:Uncharacterized protein n=1 Tax=Malaciobacter pacificus TaxID=1080223 RepID=A0A5C2HAS1_9BACT|nr:hypothetical protein [Malaciobacter pacificus]QEP34625.1 hypothetical protein APAC_1517 [Malaciobacter pacificus]GGD37306.1 hypothetical protein GCM10012288_09250 [Malaciobacter pacificus]
MKKQLIEEIKELIKINPEETIEINPNYLEYFDIDELIDIKNKLKLKRNNIIETNSNFLDEIYEKTKKDEI